ncbi:unnamed protein product [Sphagnum jensenii]|uniref:Uncharacterized protein n=1 Tax=Sphagnum jensenii TaxID=128206 RepID=A0ABP1B2R6_9BRYO
MVNARPLSLWAVERGEAAAASNEAGTSNGPSATGGWRYGTCLSVRSGEPIAKHNLPFRPPTTQLLPDEKSPTPLRNQERGISGGASQESRLQTSMEEDPVKMCIPEAPEQLNSQKRKTLGMPTYLLSNGKRSAIKPFTPPRQVAVSGSGALARPTSSLQQMAPAGNKLQKTTEFKHPAGLSSWDVGQVSTSGQDLQVPSSFIVQYPQVPSPSTIRYTQQQHSPGSYSLASNSSTVRHPHAYSSSEGRYPQQTLQVQHSRASDSSSEMRQTGELPDWRSAPAPEQPLFQTAAGRPVQVSASAMARAHALLGE